MRPRPLLVAVSVLVALTACTGPPTTSTERPTAVATADVIPTMEPTQAPVPATVVVAGSGAPVSVEAGVVCLSWSWGGDGVPPLTDGMTFVVDEPDVRPPTWSASPAGCTGQPGRACVGATLTAVAPACLAGFARVSGPTADDGATALVGMRGTLTCADPATAADCQELRATLDATTGGSADLESFPVTNGDG